MKITLLTQELHDQLLNIYNSFPELFLQNTGYEGINKDSLSSEAKEADKQVNTILKQCIEGFSYFQNFRLSKKTAEIELRFQYHYYSSYVSVGYILLSELLNGFNEN